MKKVLVPVVLSLTTCGGERSSDSPANPPVPPGTSYFSLEMPSRSRVTMVREPAPAELEVTSATRRQGATTAAGVAALAHTFRHAARWKLDASSLASIEVAHVVDTGRGAIVAKLRQRIDGVPVVRSHLSVVMNRDLELIALLGELHPNKLRAVTPRLAASDALVRAGGDVGRVRSDLTPTTDRNGYQRFTASDLVGTARARKVYVPIGDELVLGWETELATRDSKRRIAGARRIVAIDDGRLLVRHGLTADAAFSYRVWAETTGEKRFLDGPLADVTPHPTGTPDGVEPPFVAPSLVTIDGFNTNPQNTFDPWLPAGATTTQGNNVAAYADLDFQDGLSAGDVLPAVTAPGVFDRSYDPQVEPDVSTAQQMASVTHLFYVNNWLHDYFYDSGFTESAGNAQTNNFGRGGVGGDALHAEGQDSSGTDNANMFTPSDGESPVMQMFVFSAPASGPRRDGTIDSGIIAHEWGHYIHHRLVDCGSQVCGSMSEGWGDFMALMSTVRAGDNLDGTWGVGAYPLKVFTQNAAYFGIRRYPYSVDFTKSPLTFRFVQSGVPMPPNVAFSDISFLQGSDNWEVHNSGEIWSAMLWEGLIDLLKVSRGPSPRLTFDEARRRYADYVVAGMAAAPVEPNYIEQRDAILAAAAAGDTADFLVLATAYARRGFGTAAVSPSLFSPDGSGVVESFDLTGSLSIDAAIVEDAASCDGDGVLDAGESGTVRITVRNIGAFGLTNTTVSAATTTVGLVFPTGNQVNVGGLAAGASRVVTLAVRLDEVATNPQQLAVTVTANDPSAAVATVERTISAQANFDELPNAQANETFEGGPFVWTASANGFVRRTGSMGEAVGAVDVAANGDHTMQSPGLVVSAAANFTMLYRHHYSFASGTGGVVELSTDGVNFSDVSTLVNPIYDATINDPQSVLDGRAAYTGDRPNYTNVQLDFGTQFAGQTVFIRFHAGGTASPSRLSTWEIDDVVFGGIDNTPFPSVGPETGPCLPGQRPLANAGATFEVVAGAAGTLDGSGSTDPDGGTLTFEWTQLAGPVIALSSTTVAQPTFTAPAVTNEQTARFQLIVRDPDNRVSAPSVVRVRIVLPGVVDMAPDAGVAPPDAAVDAPEVERPDAGTPLTGGGGGCCGTTSDPRSALALSLVVGLCALGRRRRRGR